MTHPPRDPLGHWVNTRFDHDTHYKIMKLAASVGTTRSVLIREAVAQYLARLVPDVAGRDL